VEDDIMAANDKPSPLAPEEQALVEEFRHKPVGQHSPQLQQLINRLRGEPLEGKYVVVCTEPHKTWVLARMNGRGKPIEIHHDIVFHDVNDAEQEIFRLRMLRHLNKKID
jgi:hypothetical protein